MAAFIEETGRSFPNPIGGSTYKQTFKRPASGKYRSNGNHSGPGTDYQITFQNSGAGSNPLGSDIVHYIGATRTVSGGDGGRQGIYRFWRPTKADHHYSDEPGLVRENFGNENENWEQVAQGYNAEPRNGKPVFWVMRKQVGNSQPLKLYYSYWPDDTMLTVGSSTPTAVGEGRDQYKLIRTIGYVFTSESDANAYKDPNEDVAAIYHYKYQNPNGVTYGEDIDNFYTIDPSREVNLSGGPIAPAVPFDGLWVYQGIIGYCFTKDDPNRTSDSVVDGSIIGPTGNGFDRSGWYAYDSNNTGSGRYSGNPAYSYNNYRMFDPVQYSAYNGANPGTPGLGGWGNALNGVEILDANANFEWFYGLSGATKAAVPRYLGFEDSYDTQFMYYVYDTSYPWNGPVFSCQYVLNNAPCCPTNSNQPCVPSLSFHSHFYEIRQDSWLTNETRIKINDGDEDTNACFFEIDTKTKRLLFRYTSNNGNFFARGQKLNGWDITAVYYFGDELKCGMMEFSGNGNDFSYGAQITSETGATALVMAGRGIPNKAAFCGVYEFPKRISYYKIELDPNALIPHRTLDEAKLKAVVNNKGEITKIKIINGGVGYKNPSLKLIDPRVMDDFSASDTSKFVKKHSPKMNADWNKAIPAPSSKDENQDHIENTYSVFDIKDRKAKGTSKNKEKVVFREAQVEITRVDSLGSIRSIRIIDGGAGYNQANLPEVFVSDPEQMKFKSPSVDEGATSIENMGREMADAFNAVGDYVPDIASEDSDNRTGIAGSLTEITQGKEITVPDSYIRVAEESQDTTSHCFNIKQDCINIDANAIVSKAMPDEEVFSVVSQINPGVATFEKQVMPQVYQTAKQVDTYNEDNSHVYGAFGKSNCIRTGQPKLYNISRWFDMPCAYLDVGSEKNLTNNLPNIEKVKREGSRTAADTEKAYGYMPYKYCASEQESASFKVSLEIKGKTTGAQGEAFMNFFKKQTKPVMMPRRVVPKSNASGNAKVWNCNDGTVDGRCYRNPANSADIIFIPIGGDENTYDYNSAGGFSEVGQLQLWMGSNVTGTTSTTTSNTGSGGNISYNALNVNCGSYPGAECWDTYTRGSGNTTGPLDVYSGYNASGNGIAGQRWWEISAFGRTNPWCTSCTSGNFSGQGVGLTFVNDISVAVNPQRVDENNNMRLGPYDGNMTVRNWLSGSTVALGRALNNNGNPYFDECSDTVPQGRPYTAGTKIHEEFD